MPPGVRTSKQLWPYQVNVVSGSRPMGTPPGRCYIAATLERVPATQIAQNLAFVNWTVLTGLALGSYAAVVLLRRRTTATPGYLRFTTICALGFGVLAVDLRRRAAEHARRLPGRRRSGLGRRRATWRCCCSACSWPRPRWSPAAPAGARRRAVEWAAARRRGRDAPVRRPRVGRRLARRRRAARPAGGRQRGDRRRLRGDDPRPLVPGDAEAARGTAHPARARPARRRRRPGRAVRGPGSGPAPGRPTSRRSRRWSGRGRCSSGCG